MLWYYNCQHHHHCHPRFLAIVNSSGNSFCKKLGAKY